MKVKKLNGLAVVEESGVLAGNISASDLRQIGNTSLPFSSTSSSDSNIVIGEAGDMFKVVEYPIAKFLEKIGQDKPVSITGQTTIKEVPFHSSLILLTFTYMSN